LLLKTLSGGTAMVLPALFFLERPPDEHFSGEHHRLKCDDIVSALSVLMSDHTGAFQKKDLAGEKRLAVH